MWDVDHKEGWTPKNWWFWTVVLEKTLESHLDCKEIKPVNPKGNQSWTFIRRTDAETEAPILWLPHVKSWLTGRDLDAGKDQRQDEKETIEDEIVGWHHWFNGHGFEQAQGGGEGQGSLGCWSPWGRKQLDMTEQQGCLCNPMDYGHQAPLAMGFSRQEYQSGLPWALPGDLPNPEIKLASLMFPASADRFFTSSATQEAHNWQNIGWV